MSEQEFNEQMYLPNYEKLCLRANVLTGNQNLSVDLVQETFMKAFIARERFDNQKAKPITWLNRIMRNTFYDNLKKSKQIPTEEFDTNKPIEDEQDKQLDILTLPYPKVFQFYLEDKLKKEEIMLEQPSEDIKKDIKRDERVMAMLFKITIITKSPTNINSRLFRANNTGKKFHPNPSHHIPLLKKICQIIEHL